MELTVAICTWNRAELLDQTLQQMQQLNIPKSLDWELIIVNNNCTDNTDEVVGKYLGMLPIQLLHEPESGLSRARNLAVLEARATWVLFTDDDVLVSENWLAAYAKHIETVDSSVAFLGGEIVPWFPVDPDPAMAESISMVKDGFCARALPSNRRMHAGLREFPYGANFAFNKRLAGELRFDPDLGPNGSDRILGDDTVFMKSLLDGGYEGEWVEDASVQHYVDPERLTHKSLRKALFDSGRTYARRGHLLEGRFRLWGIPLWVFRSVLEGFFHLCFPVVWMWNRKRYYQAFFDLWMYSGYMRERMLGRKHAT